MIIRPVHVNRDFHAFRNLQLLPSGVTTSWGHEGFDGAYLANADDLDSLLPLLDHIDLLEHKMHIEAMARTEREWAEHEKRRAFGRV